MKTYIATYYRHNPQLSSGGYQTTRKIEAVSITSARKKAREITERVWQPGAAGRREGGLSHDDGHDGGRLRELAR